MPTSKPPAKKKAARMRPPFLRGQCLVAAQEAGRRESEPAELGKPRRMNAIKTRRGVLIWAHLWRCDAEARLDGFRAHLPGATVVPVIVREVAPAKKRRGK